MINFLKTALLIIYLLAALGPIVPLPVEAVTVLRYAAIILLAAHVLEALIAFKHVSRHPGPLFDSLVLTLLSYGFSDCTENCPG